MNRQETPGMFETPKDLAIFAMALIGLMFMGYAIVNWLGGGR
jgi:hypothetical protein